MCVGADVEEGGVDLDSSAIVEGELRDLLASSATRVLPRGIGSVDADLSTERVLDDDGISRGRQAITGAVVGQDEDAKSEQRETHTRPPIGLARHGPPDTDRQEGDGAEKKAIHGDARVALGPARFYRLAEFEE